MFPLWTLPPARFCTNCGQKLKWQGGECHACGYRYETPRFGNELALVFCRTCGCVYAEACRLGHKVEPYKPTG